MSPVNGTPFYALCPMSITIIEASLCLACVFPWCRKLRWSGSDCKPQPTCQAELPVVQKAHGSCSKTGCQPVVKQRHEGLGPELGRQVSRTLRTTTRPDHTGFQVHPAISFARLLLEEVDGQQSHVRLIREGNAGRQVPRHRPPGPRPICGPRPVHG